MYPLPDWVKEYRPHQIDAIENVVDAFSRVDVVVLDAPTGSGKTLIAETVRRRMDSRAVYICTSKSLQDQFLSDYPYAKVVKGRGNYPTENYADSYHPGQWAGHVSCEDCTWSVSKSCGLCATKVSCPYERAKIDARLSELAVLNTSYFLTEANRVGRFSHQPLVIVDEADELESALMGYVEVNVSEGRLRRWGWDVPKKVTVAESWVEWIEDKIEKLTRVRGAMRKPEPLDTKGLREWKYVNGLLESLKGMQIGENSWVYTGRKEGDRPGKGVSFKCSRVDDLGKGNLWRHSKKWLLMSATIISSSELLSSLGWDGEYETVRVKNTFPVKNRVVKYRGVATNSRVNQEDAWPKIAGSLKGILAENPSHRILVHSVSYAQTRYLSEFVANGRPVFSYNSPQERQQSLTSYRNTEAAVLIAPSMDRGIDLPGELCRVQVLVKVPFGYLGDRQISSRLHSPGGQEWYTVNTIRKVVQMCGRGVRSVDDWCMCVAPETRILTGDLHWVHAADLNVGDKLLAFDETTSRADKRKWRPGKVVATGIDFLPRYRIILSTGEVLIATPNHRWISKWGQAKDDSWVRTDQLRKGHHLNRYVHPWTQLSDFDSGWLSGFFDGEGCYGQNQGARNQNVTSITANQKPGEVFAQACRIASTLGFTYRVYRDKRNILTISIKGGMAEHLRFMGQVRPRRLLRKMIDNEFGQRFMSRDYVEVSEVHRIDDGPMVTLQSSTETYIAEGFASHNTYILDNQFKDRLWNSGRGMFPSWFVEAIEWR